MIDIAHRRRGYSFFGISVSVVILGLLAAVISPAFLRRADRVEYREIADEFRRLEGAVRAYHCDVGTLAPLNDISGFSADERSPVWRHFRSGDGREGWNGPYLDEIRVQSRLGGTYDIDTINASQATIDLGTKRELGDHYPEALLAIDEILDDDGDPTRGAVWGDDNGIHYGFNYRRR